MKLLESANEYMINETEYFYNVDSPKYCPTSIKAYVPKFMPQISQGTPKVTKGSVSTGIFCNSQKCKPIPSKIVNLQNYITLVKPPNLSPSYYSTSKGGVMIKNTKHILKIINRDIRQMYFIEDV